MTSNIGISVREVAEALRGGAIRLIDVRTEEEHAIAHIEGATLLTDQLAQQILTWPKDTPIVLHCHMGGRSMDAARYLTQQGFTNVKSMNGGIDAWSIEIDPVVPRY